MWKIVLLPLTALIFSNCSSPLISTDEYYKVKYIHSTKITNFEKLTQDLVDKIYNNKKFVGRNTGKPLYVVDFVNLDNLDNQSKLGFLLSNEVKTHMTNRYNFLVKELELSKYIKIGSNGSKLLSRDQEELKSKKVLFNSEALVGTYVITQRQMILYLKLIDLDSGTIIKSSSAAVELTDELLELDKRRKDLAQQYAPVTL